MKITCTHCGKEIELTPDQAAAAMGGVRSDAKAAAARRNAKKGGWPKGRPRKTQPQN